jgi:hypothetical protein
MKTMPERIERWEREPGGGDSGSGICVKTGILRHPLRLSVIFCRVRRTAKRIFGILFALAVAFCFWPSPKYDLRRVSPALRGLVLPCKSVEADYYLDGGSIGLTLVDGSGRTLRLALPVSGNGTGPYLRLFINATNFQEPCAVEVPFNEDTRRMIDFILDRDISVHPSKPEEGYYREVALLKLRGDPKDYWRIMRVMGLKTVVLEIFNRCCSALEPTVHQQFQCP